MSSCRATSGIRGATAVAGDGGTGARSLRHAGTTHAERGLRPRCGQTRDADLRWRARARQRIETEPARQDSVPVRTGERLAATVALLAGNSLFAALHPDELEQLAATAYPMSFEPGDLLCVEGGESPECYIVEEGRRAVVTIGRKGVATVGEHDVVGERGVLLDTVRAATVTAMTHMITYAISRERLRALVAGNAAAREWMLAEMVRRYLRRPMKCPSARPRTSPIRSSVRSAAHRWRPHARRAAPATGRAAKFCRKCRAVADVRPAAAPDPRAYTPKHLAEKHPAPSARRPRGRAQAGDRALRRREGLDGAGRAARSRRSGTRIMDRFFAILADGVHRFEGTVNQYTGDGIMALFGAPIAHEDHAQRACYAGAPPARRAAPLRRRAAPATQASTSRCAWGINSGEVVVGKIGDDLRMDYTAQGHTVGLARAHGAARRAGQGATSPEHTGDARRGLLPARATSAQLAVKGVRGAAAGLRARRASGSCARASTSRARRGFSRFVGRADEMAGARVGAGTRPRRQRAGRRRRRRGRARQEPALLRVPRALPRPRPA